MNQNFGQIIRKNQAKNAGSCRLDHNAIHIQRSASAVANQKSVPEKLCPPQIRIAETAPQYVVLECTCSCGTKTYIQCDYNMEK